jgi:hypothetical protein
MHVLKKILYKPYTLLAIGFGGWLYYYATHNAFGPTLSAVGIYIIYMFMMLYIFRFMEYSLLKVINKFSFAHNIPNHVLSGYCFIFTMFFPQFALPLALISKLFIKESTYHQSFMDEHGNEVTRIKSLTPTLFYTRRNGQEDEHIVVTKLKKKPTKITYE